MKPLRISMFSRLVLSSSRRSKPMPVRCLSSRAINVSAHNNKGSFLTVSPAREAASGLNVVRKQGTEADKPGPTWTEVTFEEMKQLIANQDVFLIDVREPEEVKEFGKIEGSINIPIGRLVQELKNTTPLDFKEKFGVHKPSRNQTNIVFYGQAKWGLGVKSGAAVQMANKMGFGRTRHYPGGFREWHEKHSH